MTTTISVWLDRTSEETPHWIVSAEDGESSKTLYVCAGDADGYASAISRAEAIADEHGGVAVNIDSE